MPLNEIIALVGAGGNVGILLLVWVAIRIDRRLQSIERDLIRLTVISQSGTYQQAPVGRPLQLKGVTPL